MREMRALRFRLGKREVSSYLESWRMNKKWAWVDESVAWMEHARSLKAKLESDLMDAQSSLREAQRHCVCEMPRGLNAAAQVSRDGTVE